MKTLYLRPQRIVIEAEHDRDRNLLQELDPLLARFAMAGISFSELRDLLKDYWGDE